MKKLLILFVEGKDDTLFFKHFIEQCFPQYDKFEYIEYAEMPKAKIVQELQGTVEEEKDFIFLADFDFRDGNPFNIKDKETELIKKWNLNALNGRVYIIVNEIESWFLAGFDEKFCSGNYQINRTKIKNCIDTQLVTKEFFQHASTKSHRQLMSYLVETRKKKYFNYEKAKERNKSFARFVEKFELQLPQK